MVYVWIWFLKEKIEKLSDCPLCEMDFGYQESLEQHVKTINEEVMKTHLTFEMQNWKTNAFSAFNHQETFKNIVNNFYMIESILMDGKW